MIRQTIDSVDDHLWYQHVQYFCVSKQRYRSLGFVRDTPILIHVIKLLCTISDNPWKQSSSSCRQADTKKTHTELSKNHCLHWEEGGGGGRCLVHGLLRCLAWDRMVWDSFPPPPPPPHFPTPTSLSCHLCLANALVSHQRVLVFYGGEDPAATLTTTLKDPTAVEHIKG